VSEPVRAAAKREIDDDTADVRLIRNGLRFPDDEPAPWPARGYLLGIGRLLDQKGFDVAVEALAFLSDSHPDLELVIAGGGPDLEKIRAHAARWGVSSRVRMLGPVPRDEIRALLDRASIAIVPSRHTEGFSLAALEAAHAARPVIASAVGGVVETVEDGITGVLVPPDRPIELARAIAQMIDDPEGTALMGKRGHERADERFAFDTCVDEYHRLYQDLAAIGPQA
jgi:glycosyltransferase involved in cell wall biosynthesis